MYKTELQKSDMKFQTIKDVEDSGFTGFISIENLQNGTSMIPSCSGVYMVIRAEETEPQFLTKGTGGFFKKQDPNVGIDVLRDNWVDNSCVLYIGQSKSLRERIRQYIHFGQGKPIGHKGGRYIWQLNDAKQLLICWKKTPEGNHQETERLLIQEFRSIYGKRPFANLVG